MNPLYYQAHFLLSAPDLRHTPADDVPEVAFGGRSNAGKSSAINVLTNQNSLARTSGTPGRTQQINFFTIGDQCRLVDLPGYGYAKVPKSVRQHWEAALADYLRDRTNLRGVVVIMDVRRPFTDSDNIMLEWCRQIGLPLHILLTKADKLKRGKAKNALLGARKQAKEMGLNCSIQLFSALKKEGVDEVHAVLDQWFAPEVIAD